MKRLVLFLVLLAAGLALLRWIEGPRRVLRTTAADPGEETGDPDEPRPGLSIRGRFETTLFDPESGRGLVRFESADSRTEGASDRFLGFQAEILDPKTDPSEVQAVVRAESASIRRVERGETLRPVHQNRIDLTDTVTRVLTGTPLAPVEFRAPTAVVDAVDPAERTIRSPDPVVLSSASLDASGVGVSFSFDRDLLVLEEQSQVRFRREGETLARLVSSGPVRLFRSAERASILWIEAQDASIEFEGDDPSRLEAQRIRIRGREPSRQGPGAPGPAPGEPLAIESVDAAGQVAWSRGETLRFTGERARIVFEEGEPARALLFDLPAARIVLPSGAEPLPDVPEEFSRVHISGRGPLEVTWGEEDRFSLRGPATVESPGATLRSLGGVRGWIRGDDAAGFHAGGGVVLESQDGTLETAELEWELAPAPDGRTTELARATGGPRLTGRLEDGREFAITSPDLLELRGEGRRWVVVDSRSVVASLGGENGFVARAERVELFDPATLDVVASGAVSFESPRGAGGGERLRLEGGETFLLRGSAGERAHFEGPEGDLRAVFIHGSPGQLRALSSVEARVEPDLSELPDAGESYGVSCEELEILRSPPGESPRRLRVEARRSVQTVVPSSRGTTTVSGGTLLVHREEYAGTDQGDPGSATTHILVRDSVSAELLAEAGRIELDCEELEIERKSEGDEPWRESLDARRALAFRFERTAAEAGAAAPAPPTVFRGRGERLFLRGDGEGLLEPAPGERVRIEGTLPSHDAPCEIEADRFLLSGGRLFGELPTIHVRGLGVSAEGGLAAGGLEAASELLEATPETFELSGDARIEAATASGVPWRLRAGRVLFEGSAAGAPENAELRGLRARDDVEFLLGSRGTPIEEAFVARGTGDELVGSALFGELRLSGSPARIESPLFISENEWISFDPDLQIILATGRGGMLPAAETAGEGGEPDHGHQEATGGTNGGTNGDHGGRGGTNGGTNGGQEASGEEPAREEPLWRLEYFSSKTLVEPDSLIYILQQPVFHEPGSGGRLQASWAVFWLDRRRWTELPDRIARGELSLDDLRFAGEGVREAEDGLSAYLFEAIEGTGLAGVLRETYFEGPVEVLFGGDLLARADALYLDAVAGHGWLANPTVNVYGHLVGQDFDKLIVKTDWLRYSRDGSWRANRATVTPCDFDEPHIRVVTGDLRIRQKRRDVFDVLIKDNRVELYDLIALPLPTLNFSTDERGRPLWDSLEFGDSARFGSFVSAGVARPAEGVGRAMNQILGGHPFDYDASYSIDGSYLGSRGVLLDLGLQVESKDRYWLDMHLGGLPDSGEDRGYVRVPEEDRDDLRLWYRARGRYFLDERQWLDLSLTYQTDPGVRSEFFEDEFERYEQDESYLRWRRARGSNFYDANLKKRLEASRTDIEELPSAGVFVGRRPLLRVGPVSLVYSGEARAEHLRRREGDAGLQSPFGFPSRFADGLGDRSVLRLDASQRLEVPFPLGFLGLRATPFVGARLTGWSDDVDEETHAARLVGEAGARLSTVLWHEGERGHQIVPFVQVRSDFVQGEGGGDPVRFDGVENPMDGTFLDAGARGRFALDTEGGRVLDLDLRGTHASSVPGSPDGWQPLAVFARLGVDTWKVPVEIWHDARYDVEDTETVFALTAVGFRPTQRLRFEGGHRVGTAVVERIVDLGLGPTLVRGPEPFEAATLAGIYRWTEKWEFEGRQTFSLREDQDLDSRLVLRRYGHDAIFELETSVREGEGTSVGISIKPRFGDSPPRLGYISF